MDKKKILIGCLIFIILASIGTSIYIIINKEEESKFIIDGINLPENDDILKDALAGDLKITEISLITRDGISTFKAKVSNNTENNIDIDKLYVVFYEDEKETKSMALYNTSLPANNETYINITSEKDLTKVTKIEYILE